MKIKLFLLFTFYFLLFTQKVAALDCNGTYADFWCDNKPYPGSCGHSGCGYCDGPDLHVNYGDWGSCCSWWCNAKCPTDNTSDCTSSCSACNNSAFCSAHAPPPGGNCDTSCGNQCGYRRSDNSCTTDNACCHRACINNSCHTVAGGGTNECDGEGSSCGSSCTPSGCDGTKVNMGVSPNPANTGQSITFSLSGSQGSTYVGDSFSGGVSCSGFPTTWPTSQTCTAMASGTFTWTHFWRNCACDFDHCTPQCYKIVSFSINQVCPPAQSCPATCHTDTQYVPNGSCGQTTCPSNAPAAQSCPSTCHNTTVYVPNGSCGQITCPSNAPAAQSCPAACHTDTQYVPNGSCGQTTCSPNAPAAQSCPNSCHSTTIYVPNGACGQTTCPSNAPAAQSCPSTCHTNTVYVPNGACGQTTCPSNAPAAQSCPTACDYPGGTVDNGACGQTTCPATSSCITTGGIIIENSSDITVNVESGDRNQICQTIFTNHDRKVQFILHITDSSGANKIQTVKIALDDYMITTYDNLTTGITRSISGGNASFYENVTPTVSGLNMVATFPIYFPQNFTSNIYNIKIFVQDINGSVLNKTATYTDTNRDIKIWDCNVPVSGELFDNSSNNVCPNYQKSGKENEMNLKQITFNDITAPSPGSDIIISDIDASGNYPQGQIHNLIWGNTYRPEVNPDFEATALEWRLIDLGTNQNDACNQMQFAIDNNNVNPYSTSPALKVDFAAIRNQTPWYQVSSGGIRSKTNVSDAVPSTCYLHLDVCTPAMAIQNSTYGTNGLVAAPSISNTSGCGSNCHFGNPNNWSVNTNIIDKDYSYTYLYNKFYAQMGLGTVLNTGTSLSQIVSNLGGTGIIFVNGKLDVDTNNTVIPGNYLMIIAKNEINFNYNVNQVDGLFISDKSISTSGSSATQLNINGLLYSTGSSVALRRSFSDTSQNNTSPSSVVNYRPDLIFSLPGNIQRILSDWSEY